MKFPLVEIKWTDATSGEEWIEISQLAKLKVRGKPSRTAGYLVAESPQAVMVAAIVNRDHVGSTTVIPKKMISSMKRID